jgi:choline dehydrogenase
MSVVDNALRVYGIDNLRVADASIMPRITTGNPMAPCVVIGERAADMLIDTHAL